MTLREKLLPIVGIVAASVASFVAGRATAPDRVREVSSKVEKRAVAASVETATAAIVETRTVDRWRTRVVTRPDGTRIETRETIASNEKKEAIRETTRRSESRSEERSENRTRETARAVAAPRLVVSLGVGTMIPPRALPSVIPGLPSRLVLTATASVRVVGPVYVGVFATSTGAVGLGASVSF